MALARGEPRRALQLLGSLVSRAMMGRGSCEHWAYAEYGWLLFQVRRRAGWKGAGGEGGYIQGPRSG